MDEDMDEEEDDFDEVVAGAAGADRQASDRY